VIEYQERNYASLRCLVSVPQGEPPPSGWPLLVFLHGSEEAAPVPLRDALTRHGPLRRGSAVEATRDFVVIAPQLPAPGGNVWAAKAGAVATLAEEVSGEVPVNPAQVYLTGFSYGGNGVLALARARPNGWAALWAVDPPAGAAPPGNQPLFISVGPLSRDRIASFAGLTRATEPLAGRRLYHDAGLGHVETARAAYANNAVYVWLKTHSLNAR